MRPTCVRLAPWLSLDNVILGAFREVHAELQFRSGLSRLLIAAFREGSLVNHLRLNHCHWGYELDENRTGTICALERNKLWKETRR
jgi:hypothetical protein